MRGADGRHSEPFATIVIAATNDSAILEAGVYSANHCAAVFDVVGTLDAKALEASYERIAAAKRLRKHASIPESSQPHTNVTLGLVLAQQCTLASNELMDEIQRLNAKRDSREWPDMITVFTVGVVNYAVQFPGESISGDYLPPAANAFEHSAPPIYIVPVIKPAGDDSFGRMLAFLIGHLSFYTPGALLPNRSVFLEGMTDQVIIGVGYQYDLQGILLPVPEERYLERQLPIVPFQVEDSQGTVLATVRFVPWQDGGIVILRGTFPLEAILLFGGPDLVRRGGVSRPNDIQISNVIPLSESNFVGMLKSFQRKSNLVVRQQEAKWTIQKIGDEGTETPIIGRLHLGLLRIRDIVCHTEAARMRFDEKYEIVLSSFMSARSTAHEMKTRWLQHEKDVASGKVSRMQGKTIHVDESIDKELKAGIESFVNASVRVVKMGMQQLAKEYGVDVGCLFQQDNKFAEKIEAMRDEHPLLADYLLDARQWTEPLVALRNKIEHEGWMRSRVTYSASGVRVSALQPVIDDVPLIVYAESMLDRVACFVEEITAYVLGKCMSPMITLTEISIANRSARCPERFQIALVAGGAKPWKLRHSDIPFNAR